ncbi:MAG TPA: class D sortase [Bryobacteraceae bacterium]
MGIWAWSQLRTSIYQDWQNWAFERQVRGERPDIAEYLASKFRRTPAPKSPAPTQPQAQAPPTITVEPREKTAPPPNNGLLGRLAIPRLHLSAMVREGIGEDTLSLALGHIPSTALPGQTGNVGVAGHRDTLFRRLRDIRLNDEIRFETLSGTHVYQVETTEVVQPEDVVVLKAGAYPQITLVTCYPFTYVGSAPDRFIVKAREVSSDGPVQEPPERHQVASDHGEKKDIPPVESKRTSTRRAQAVSARDSRRASRDERNSARTIRFAVSKSHSRELAPGISLGLTGTNVSDRRVNGWLWVMPERRTIWLRGQRVKDPVLFYRDGRRRELVITKVSSNSVSGYILASGNAR